MPLGSYINQPTFYLRTWLHIHAGHLQFRSPFGLVCFWMFHWMDCDQIHTSINLDMKGGVDSFASLNWFKFLSQRLWLNLDYLYDDDYDNYLTISLDQIFILSYLLLAHFWPLKDHLNRSDLSWNFEYWVEMSIKFLKFMMMMRIILIFLPSFTLSHNSTQARRNCHLVKRDHFWQKVCFRLYFVALEKLEVDLKKSSVFFSLLIDWA